MHALASARRGSPNDGRKLRLLALGCIGAAPRSRLWSRMRGLTRPRTPMRFRSTTEHTLRAESIRFGQKRSYPARDGPLPAARLLGSMLKMECAFAHFPLDVHNMVDEGDEISSKIFIANLHATRQADSRSAGLAF